MNPPITRPWELPEIVAAVNTAPPLPDEAIEICKRVFTDLTEELYERRLTELAEAGETRAA